MDLTIFFINGASLEMYREKVENKIIEEIIGYITIAVGTIGLFGELSFYHKLLEFINSSKIRGGVNTVGVYFMVAFITLLPPLIILIGLSLITKDEDTATEEKTSRNRKTTNGL